MSGVHDWQGDRSPAQSWHGGGLDILLRGRGAAGAGPRAGLLAAALTLGLAAPGAVRTGAAQTGATCVITEVSGTAEVSAYGAGRHVVAPGLGLGRNATLGTEPDARVTLACPHGLQVVVGPDTELALSGLLVGADRPFGLRLIDGIAGFLFDRDGGDGVQVSTPSAVAAVRATEWAMQVRDGTSAVFARDGSVFAVAEGGRVRLRAGEGIDVTRKGEVGPVRRWGRARIDGVAALLGPGW